MRLNGFSHTHTHKAVSLLQAFHGIMLIEEEEKSRHQGIKVLAASDFFCSIIKHNAAVAFIDLLPPQKKRAAVRKSKKPIFFCVYSINTERNIFSSRAQKHVAQWRFPEPH